MIIRQYKSYEFMNKIDNECHLFQLFNKNILKYTRHSIKGNSSIGAWTYEELTEKKIMNYYSIHTFYLELVS